VEDHWSCLGVLAGVPGLPCGVSRSGPADQAPAVRPLGQAARGRRLSAAVRFFNCRASCRGGWLAVC